MTFRMDPRAKLYLLLLANLMLLFHVGTGAEAAATALCLLLCGCGKKDAAEAQAVQQRYAALTGAVAEAEIVSHPEGETRSFTVRCTCDRTKDTATTTVMAPEELAGLSATVTGAE